MRKKTAPALTVLAIEIKTNMKNLISDVGNLNTEIFKSAIDNGLHPSGPQFWMYKWTSENLNPETEFLLTICLPVATFGIEYKGEGFRLLNLPPFSHIAKEHLGSWSTLSTTYNEIMEEMKMQALKPGTICRELYINSDFVNPENNITEIQFEII